MQNNTPQNLDMNAIRNRLRASREAGAQTAPSTPQNKSYIQQAQTPPQFNPPEHNPHISRQPSLARKVESYKPALNHAHNYWHLYIAAFTFLLFHTIGAFPQYFPGMGNMESLYGRAPVIAFFLLSLPTVFVFFVLTSLRRSLQNAAKITESKNWTQVEWIGAAIMFGLIFYLTFLRADPLEHLMVEEAIKGPFELTPREWIMAGVKCVGGAVTGALLARKFFGDYSEE